MYGFIIATLLIVMLFSLYWIFIKFFKHIRRTFYQTSKFFPLFGVLRLILIHLSKEEVKELKN